MHCCQRMSDEVISESIIEYSPIDRRYCIARSYGILANFDYCPWCGTKLPGRLHQKIFDVLINEIGMPFDEIKLFEDSNVPEEFQSDEWWKKRGL